MLALGLARMGWIVRWAPNSVLTGFINAVAVSIVPGQLDNVTGYPAEGSNRVTKALNTAPNVGAFIWHTPGIVSVLSRTRQAHALSVLGRQNVFRATAAVTASTRQAMASARRIVDRPR